MLYNAYGVNGFARLRFTPMRLRGNDILSEFFKGLKCYSEQNTKTH